MDISFGILSFMLALVRFGKRVHNYFRTSYLVCRTRGPFASKNVLPAIVVIYVDNGVIEDRVYVKIEVILRVSVLIIFFLIKWEMIVIVKDMVRQRTNVIVVIAYIMDIVELRGGLIMRVFNFL